MSKSPQSIIEQAWENRANLSPEAVSGEIRNAVNAVLEGLNTGSIRVAERRSVGKWEVNQWVKKAVLLSFRLEDNKPMGAGGYTQFYDKVPSKFENYTAEDFANGGFRVVPPAMARRGSFIGKNAVLMPSYVNIGAYVGEGTMVDTCIIEDNCFIGARSEVVEGVVIEENAVLSMGVYIGQSTKIYDRETGEIHYGRVPAGSVVVPGSLPSACGKYSLYAAVIVKKVDAQTRAKTAINELLRD
ncbi:MAG: 2,3,4,5-tetrahydropyridine-2,6-dicarboxylate N-succinyltransferase [Polynucleobacter sp. 17-46-58]|nr:MAG: 2,3,4,5-tetrahydropyridine-2,6-dicarboxylate N-succinyltransferase [Polynucleobacter sp. 17-46-58]